jgi:N-acetylneuraminic acid mutarotase
MTKQHWMGVIVGILFTGVVDAQVGQLEWHKGIMLPSMQDGKAHIGLAGPIAGVTGDCLLIAGGANFPHLPPWEGGAKEIQKEVFIYRKEGAGLHLTAQDSLSVAVAYAASLSLPDGLLVIGGETPDGKTATCRLIKYDNPTKKITVSDFPNLPFPLANMGAVVHGNKLLVAGGEMQDAVSDQVLQLDLTHLEKGWGCVGKLPYAVSHLQLLSDNQNNLYLLGGRKGNSQSPSTLYHELWCSTDDGSTWFKRTDIPFSAAAGTACLLPDQGIWLLSADRGDTFHRVESLIFDAKKEANPSKRQKLIDAKNNLQINHPGFGRAIWRYDLKLKKWDRMADLPSNGPVTTTAVVWGDTIILPSGEIKAGVRSPEILVATFSNK